MVTSSIVPITESEWFVSVEVPNPPRSHTPKDRRSVRVDDEEQASIGPHMVSKDGLLDPIG